jgi:hypothetical protein
VQVAVSSNSSKTITLEQGTSWIRMVVVRVHTGDLERVEVVKDAAEGSTGNEESVSVAKATANVAAVPREPEAAAASGHEEVEAGEAPGGATGSHGE